MYDNIDYPESDFLYVTSSQLADSGNGLFTAIDIYKDEIVAIYKGRILTDVQAKNLASEGKAQYFMNLHNGRIFDSADTPGFAKYANDAEAFAGSGFKNNCKIALNDQHKVCLIAKRKIKAGEELFCSYGKRYWDGISL